MRRFLIFPILILAGCTDQPVDIECSRGLNLDSMSMEQREHAIAYCDLEKKRAVDKPKNITERFTLTDRIIKESKKVGMTPNQFSHSRIGQVILLRELFTPALALLLIVQIWGFLFWIIRRLARLPKKVEFKPILFGLWMRKSVTEYHPAAITFGEIFWIIAVGFIFTGSILFMVIKT